MARLNLRRTSSRGSFRPLGAVEIYGLGLRTKFESYANSKVQWVILDELRKVDPMPRRARLRMRETERARNELAQTLGRVPTGLRWRDAWRWKSGSTALLDRFAPTQVGVS